MVLLQAQSDGLLVAADIFFFALHVGVVLFNLLGWIWTKTLRWHLYVMGVTLFSWLILGIWYGFGYCLITDWHWDIKRKLGEEDLPASFITYFFHSIGWQISPATVNVLTLAGFAAAAFLTVYRNIRLSRAKKGSRK